MGKHGAQVLDVVAEKCIRKHFPEEHIRDGRPGRKPIPRGVERPEMVEIAR
jgi:hypothetical protein